MNQEFVDRYGITFTMLWSDSRVPTNYYHFPTPVWSSFWLLDSTGRRIFGGASFDDELITLLLDHLS